MYCLNEPYDEIDHRNDMVIEQMNEYKNALVSKIESVVSKSYADNFAKLLVNSWFEEAPEAISISEDLTLEKIHFFAFKEEKSRFEEEYFKSRLDIYVDFD